MVEVSHLDNLQLQGVNQLAHERVFGARFLVRKDIENRTAATLRAARAALAPDLQLLSSLDVDYDNNSPTTDDVVASHDRAAALLSSAIQLTMSVIDAIGDQRIWPTVGFDRQTTVGSLRDLLPDRSINEIEFMASLYDMGGEC